MDAVIAGAVPLFHGTPEEINLYLPAPIHRIGHVWMSMASSASDENQQSVARAFARRISSMDATTALGLALFLSKQAGWRLELLEEGAGSQPEQRKAESWTDLCQSAAPAAGKSEWVSECSHSMGELLDLTNSKNPTPEFFETGRAKASPVVAACSVPKYCKLCELAASLDK